MEPSRQDQWESAREAVSQIYEYVRSVNGTTSAEHGIGISKASAFKLEKADSLDLMSQVKKAFDPHGILNPGKLMDAPADWVTATDLRYMVA
jgi:glycolate oxidase